MTTRAIAISLKIPDNAAYTALVTLRRLGVDVTRIERSEIWLFDDEVDAATLLARVKADEAIFNPNKHRLASLEPPSPRPGEVWIESLRHSERGVAGAQSKDARPCRIAIGWRLFAGNGAPAPRDVLAAAVERLLCNPAIEKPIYEEAIANASK